MWCAHYEIIIDWPLHGDPQVGYNLDSLTGGKRLERDRYLFRKLKSRNRSLEQMNVIKDFLSCLSPWKGLEGSCCRPPTFHFHENKWINFQLN